MLLRSRIRTAELTTLTLSWLETRHGYRPESNDINNNLDRFASVINKCVSLFVANGRGAYKRLGLGELNFPITTNKLSLLSTFQIPYEPIVWTTLTLTFRTVFAGRRYGSPTIIHSSEQRHNFWRRGRLHSNLATGSTGFYAVLLIREMGGVWKEGHLWTTKT